MPNWKLLQEVVTINLTSFLKLGKPFREEKYNVSVHNANMDIIDTSIKKLQDADAGFVQNETYQSHVHNTDNPHKVSKEDIGLSSLVNIRQMNGTPGIVKTGDVPVFDGNGYNLKDSGYKIEKSVPADAVFTDTVYQHPNTHSADMIVENENRMFVTAAEKAKIEKGLSGAETDPTVPAWAKQASKPAYTAAEVGADSSGSASDALVEAKAYTDEKIADIDMSPYATNTALNSAMANKVDKTEGKQLSSEDYTLAEKNKLGAIQAGAQVNSITGIKGSSETSYRTGQVNITKANIGLENAENKSSAAIRSELTMSNVTDALGYTPEMEGAYENATAYTDTKFTELSGVSSETLENINKLAAEIENNQDLIDILTNSVTSKANQAELDTHVNNNTIHVTAADKANLSTALTHSGSTHARTDATNTESSSTNGNIKINGTETKVYTHPAGTNPHGTTKSDVGLGNVPNVTTNDQTPTYTEAPALTKLASGEKLSVAFGKISKAVSSFLSHLSLTASSSQLGHVKPDGNTIIAGSDGTLSTQYIKVINIPANADLNDYHEPGFYHCAKNTTVATLKNCPTTNAFSMIINNNTDFHPDIENSRGALQEITEFISAGKKYFRNYYNEHGWYGWKRIYTTADPPPITNNLLANVAGTALDAVQGKVLNDKINALGRQGINIFEGIVEDWHGTNYLTIILSDKEKQMAETSGLTILFTFGGGNQAIGATNGNIFSSCYVNTLGIWNVGMPIIEGKLAFFRLVDSTLYVWCNAIPTYPLRKITLIKNM